MNAVINSPQLRGETLSTLPTNEKPKLLAILIVAWLLVALDNRAFSSDANYRANGWSHGAMKTMMRLWTEAVGCDVKQRLKVDKAT